MPAIHILEGQFIDQLPRRLFDLLMTHDEILVREIPKIGLALIEHLTAYYAFRQRLGNAENRLITKAGTLCGAQFRQAWVIVYKYCIRRLANISKENIIEHGDFLNYGITWASVEHAFESLEKDGSFKELLSIYEEQDRFTVFVIALLPEL